MTLRRAAGVALVGWYLMVPRPYGYSSFPLPVPNLPLSQWEILQPFDDAKACYKVLLQDRQRFQREAEGKGTSIESMEREMFMAGQCVSTDDPRLKAK